MQNVRHPPGNAARSFTANPRVPHRSRSPRGVYGDPNERARCDMGYPRDPKLKGLAAVAYHPEHLSWGTSHVTVDGKMGLVVEPASPAALREAMARLHQDPELAERLGANARRRFDASSTAAWWTTCSRHATATGDRYAAIYASLAGTGATTSSVDMAALVCD